MLCIQRLVFETGGSTVMYPLLQLIVTPTTWALYSCHRNLLLCEDDRFTSTVDLDSRLTFMASAEPCCGLPTAFMGGLETDEAACNALDIVAKHFTRAEGRCHRGQCVGVYSPKNLCSVSGSLDRISKPCQTLHHAVKKRMKRAAARAQQDTPAAQSNTSKWSLDDWKAQLKKLQEELNKRTTLPDKNHCRKVNKATAVTLKPTEIKELEAGVEAVYETPELHVVLQKLIAGDKTGTLEVLFLNNFKVLFNRQQGKRKQNRFSQHYLRISWRCTFGARPPWKPAANKCCLVSPPRKPWPPTSRTASQSMASLQRPWSRYSLFALA